MGGLALSLGGSWGADSSALGGSGGGGGAVTAGASTRVSPEVSTEAFGVGGRGLLGAIAVAMGGVGLARGFGGTGGGRCDLGKGLA